MREAFCILIPVYNESRTIASTLESAVGQLAADHVFVVDDGSRDESRSIALQYTNNVLTMQNNAGKAGALNSAVRQFNLAEKYEYIMLIDADTVIGDGFFDSIRSITQEDLNKETACIIAKVKGRDHNWLTQYRIWEYEIAQSIYKNAQSRIGGIIVASGCASIYRSDVLDRIPIPTETITEDMDYTFLLHRQNVGKMVYTDKAYVVTQDPRTIRDFVKQVSRWYTGFWQCVSKYNIPWGGQVLDAEVALLCLEGLFNCLIVLLFIGLAPAAIYTHKYELIFYPILVDACLFMLPTLYFTSLRFGKWKILLYIPLFYFMRFICSIYFLKCYLEVIFSRRKNMIWTKVGRYTVA